MIDTTTIRRIPNVRPLISKTMLIVAQETMEFIDYVMSIDNVAGMPFEMQVKVTDKARALATEWNLKIS